MMMFVIQIKNQHKLSTNMIDSFKSIMLVESL